MTRLFTDGAEMGDLLFFNSVGANTVATTAQARSGSYSYCTTNANNSYLQKNITAISEFYMRFAVFSTNVTTTTMVFQWRNGTTVLGHLRLENTNVRVYTSTGTLVASGTTVLQVNTWYLIEVHVKILDNNGIVEVRVDGNQDITFSGDTKPSTQTTVDNIYFGGQLGISYYFDDLAMNDLTGTVDNSWCGDGHVVLVYPNANGDSSQLINSTGTSVNNYDYVDEVPTNITDYVEGSTLNNYDLYHLSTLGLSAIDIKRVYVESRSLDTVAAGGKMALGIKSGNTEDWSNDISILTSNARYVGKDYLINPVTGLAWTVADIDALQAGVKVR